MRESCANCAHRERETALRRKIGEAISDLVTLGNVRNVVGHEALRELAVRHGLSDTRGNPHQPVSDDETIRGLRLAADVRRALSGVGQDAPMSTKLNAAICTDACDTLAGFASLLIGPYEVAKTLAGVVPAVDQSLPDGTGRLVDLDVPSAFRVGQNAPRYELHMRNATLHPVAVTSTGLHFIDAKGERRVLPADCKRLLQHSTLCDTVPDVVVCLVERAQ